MAEKLRSYFECQQCGARSPKWIGRCPTCNEWNTFVETREQKQEDSASISTKRGLGESKSKPIALKDIELESGERLATGLEELDRVLGGGIVAGSLILIGGDPGIGKSTLLLQVTAILSAAQVPLLYVSGEESLAQIKLRARRLSIPSPNLLALAETNLNRVLEASSQVNPKVLIIDSIQTMYKEELAGSPGAVGQLRECTLSLMINAKTSGCATFIVGHVTKDGHLAGPKMIEHMVDTVIYFEGDRHHSYRLLRAVKNRFGATNEIGVFEMGSAGLAEVKNPSDIFLEGNRDRAPGSIISCAIEGTRPILLELQALVAKASYSVPQRVTMGLDSKRLIVILALLEKFGGVEIGLQDVFVNIAGGFRAEEPAMDLALAAAITGSHLGKTPRPDLIAVGELGLNGEIRSVPQLEARLRESQRLGFKCAVIPASAKGKFQFKNMELRYADKLAQALEMIAD